MSISLYVAHSTINMPVIEDREVMAMAQTVNILAVRCAYGIDRLKLICEDKLFDDMMQAMLELY